jgi:hypothetical protein
VKNAVTRRLISQFGMLSARPRNNGSTRVDHGGLTGSGGGEQSLLRLIAELTAELR